MHYTRVLRHGTVERQTMPRVGLVCSEEACGRPVQARGLCAMHYQRSVHGHRPRPASFDEALDAQLRKVKRVARVDGMGECWIGARLSDNGYACFAFERKKFALHRAVLARKLGRPVADGMMALHMCELDDGGKAKACVNPDHLYEGSPKDNARDRWSRPADSAVG